MEDVTVSRNMPDMTSSLMGMHWPSFIGTAVISL
jgi:hypothetical protein